MTFFRTTATSLLALGLMTATAVAQDATTIQRAEQVRDQALKANIAYDYTEQVTTRFGARPAGSKSEQAAAAWAADYMRAHGFQNVRVENFPLIGWERGEESVEIVGARPQKLFAVALGHSIATPPQGIEGEVAHFTSMADLLAAPEGSLRGKIAVVDAGQMVRMQDGSGYGVLSRIRSQGPIEASKRGAVAFVMRSAGSDEHRMAHTGTTAYVEGKVPLPAFALSAPDADQIARLVGYGESVRLRLKSTARTYQTHSQNVIGDIPGSDRADEIIVLGSHMDSWDLGTGAVDDAAGGGITLAAAKLIAEQGQPRRTIRVILYGSEEVAQPVNHGNGGGAYVRGIGPAGVEKHIVAGESDLGSDRIYALQLSPGAANSEFARIAARVLAPLGILASDKPELFGGVDIAPLARAGVPVFGLKQDASIYFDLHHTADDTFDKIDPVQMNQNVAAWAGLLRLIADSDVDFRVLRDAASESAK